MDKRGKFSKNIPFNPSDSSVSDFNLCSKMFIVTVDSTCTHFRTVVCEKIAGEKQTVQYLLDYRALLFKTNIVVS